MKHASISIIIPALNEAPSLPELFQRIDTALRGIGITYEIIFIDDKSRDATKEVVANLSDSYPVRFFEKIGKKGKSFSLLQGAEHAKYDLLAIIDADLQYPPEAFPEMLAKIEHGADVVLSDRTKKNAPWARNLATNAFRLVFSTFLHGLHFDAQSGLKVFRKEVLLRSTLSPTPWTFDLEFILKARHAGYRIESVPIELAKRKSGKTKVKFLSASFEIGLSAFLLRFKDFGLIQFLPEVAAREGKGFHYKSKKFISHTDMKMHESAFIRMTLDEVVITLMIVFLLAFMFFVNFTSTLIILVAVMTFLYFSDLLFNFFIIFKSFVHSPELRVSESEIKSVASASWPTYTIFCPLYKEWSVVPQFVNAMNRLDYPREKLQVILLLEEDDSETLNHMKELKLPDFFEIAVIPDSLPKTKPKALNYGLSKARGEYIVVYDAEDVPDPLQLKKAIIAFAKSEKNVRCIQAKLNFYNPHQNLLTRAFTAEYSVWFDLVLTGLQSINAPIPLGGTSNHFRRSDIITMKGWDPFNVTEDCDLGLRIAKKGYKTAMIDSETLEEANSDLNNWFQQRTRWIKGYIQTYLVHMRDLGSFFRSGNKLHVVTFQLVVGGKILSMFINPFMWVITISYFVFRPILGESIERFYPAPILYMAIFSLVFGNFLYFFYYMMGCAKREFYDLIKFTFLIPIYWLVISAAAWRALYMIVVAPHHWFKTKHGLHLKNDQTSVETRQFFGKRVSSLAYKIRSPQPVIYEGVMR